FKTNNIKTAKLIKSSNVPFRKGDLKKYPLIRTINNFFTRYSSILFLKSPIKLILCDLSSAKWLKIDSILHYQIYSDMDILGYLASILIGISLGLIGAGGSILTVPVLVYLFS